MIRQPVTFAGSAAQPAQFPTDGLPEVAFLGRSNVGKSSLLNALAGTRGLARVSSTPGRTQLVNFFRVGDDMYLVDLPGYGYAKVPKSVRDEWGRLATSYVGGRDQLALCVFLVDSRHEPSEGDEVLRRFLEENSLRYVVAASKVDKLSGNERTRSLTALRKGIGARAQAVIGCSAEDKTGLQELWRTIVAAAKGETE